MLSTFSLFAQVLGLINRDIFEDLVTRWGMDKGNKGFQTWHQFISMLFAQLADSASLREINLGLGSASGKLRHLGLTAAPCRSTLSYANAHRPWRFYEDLFYKVYEMVAEEAGKNGKKFRFKIPCIRLIPQR